MVAADPWRDLRSARAALAAVTEAIEALGNAAPDSFFAEKREIEGRILDLMSRFMTGQATRNFAVPEDLRAWAAELRESDELWDLWAGRSGRKGTPGVWGSGLDEEEGS